MTKKLLLPILLLSINYSLSQVCPTATFNTQYNQTINLGGANGENPTTNPFTFSYTAGAGLNRLMILAITYETENVNGPNNFAAVTYGGIALTNVINQTVTAAGTQQNRLAMYYLKEAGITSRVGNTVSVSFSNPGGASPNGSINGVAVNVILFENVDQVTSIINTRSGVNPSIMTISVPSSFTATAGNYVIAAVNMALATATVGPSTPDYSVYISQQVTGSHTHSVSYKKIITTGVELPGFTANTTTRQIIGSVEVKALSIGGSCAGGLVPVKIVSFAGNLEDNMVKLLWKTENESNIASYNIQRSADAAAGFTTIGNTAARNIPLSSQYIFNDVHPLPGNSFYRLQVADVDGSLSYSNIISINRNEKGNSISVVSPFTSSINIYAASIIRQDADISLLDVSGKTILRKKLLLEKGMNSLVLPQDRFYPGSIYFLRIHAGNTTETFKIIKE